MFYLFLYLMKPILWLIFRPKVYGSRKSLGIKGKAIYICNHIAMTDPLILAIVSPRIIHFMAKKEVFEKPIGRLLFKSLLVFPVDRGTADIKSLKNAFRLLDKGKVFGIADRMDEFEHGTAFIAMRSGAPVVPIYLANDSYRKGKRPRLIVGEPLYAKDSAMQASRRENELLFTQRLRNTLETLKRELEEKCS